MNVYLRIESVDSSKYKLFTRVSHELEKQITTLMENNDFGGESIKNEFHVVIRIYPSERYEKYGEYYLPVFKFSRKKQAVLLTYDFQLEDIENKAVIEIFELFKKAVIDSINKLELKKINDVDVKKLGSEIIKLSLPSI